MTPETGVPSRVDSFVASRSIYKRSADSAWNLKREKLRNCLQDSQSNESTGKFLRERVDREEWKSCLVYVIPYPDYARVVAKKTSSMHDHSDVVSLIKSCTISTELNWVYDGYTYNTIRGSTKSRLINN